MIPPTSWQGNVVATHTSSLVFLLDSSVRKNFGRGGAKDRGSNDVVERSVLVEACQALSKELAYSFLLEWASL